MYKDIAAQIGKINKDREKYKQEQARKANQAQAKAKEQETIRKEPVNNEQNNMLMSQQFQNSLHQGEEQPFVNQGEVVENNMSQQESVNNLSRVPNLVDIEGDRVISSQSQHYIAQKIEPTNINNNQQAIKLQKSQSLDRELVAKYTQYIQSPLHIQNSTKIRLNHKIKDFKVYLISNDALIKYNQFLLQKGLQIMLFWSQKKEAVSYPLTETAKFIRITAIRYIFTNPDLKEEFENLLKLSCQRYKNMDNQFEISFNSGWQLITDQIIYRGGWGFNKYQGFGQLLQIHNNQVNAQIGFYFQGNLVGFGIKFNQIAKKPYKLQYQEDQVFNECQFRLRRFEAGEPWHYKENSIDYEVKTSPLNPSTFIKVEGCSYFYKLVMIYELTQMDEFHEYKLTDIRIMDDEN